MVLSESTVPRPTVLERLLLLQLEGNLGKLLLMHANLEFLREMFVLEAVGLVVPAPLG
jgi:hypothetical protein